MSSSSDLYYEEYGSGDDVIVLVHGFLSSSRYWKRLRPYLVTAGYRVVVIDLLGFGQAAKSRSDEYSYDDQVAYLDQIVKCLGLSNPFHLVGHSMGAVISARYALLRPRNIKSLILLHPPLYTSSIQAMQTLENTNAVYRYLLGSRHKDRAWKILARAFPAVIAAHSPEARERSLRNVIAKAELLTDLVKMKTDTLLFVGLKDRAVYLTNLSKTPVSSSVKVVKENVGHHSVVRQPRLVQKTILHFIENNADFVRR